MFQGSRIGRQEHGPDKSADSNCGTTWTAASKGEQANIYLVLMWTTKYIWKGEQGYIFVLCEQQIKWILAQVNI